MRRCTSMVLASLNPWEVKLRATLFRSNDFFQKFLLNWNEMRIVSKFLVMQSLEKNKWFFFLFNYYWAKFHLEILYCFSVEQFGLTDSQCHRFFTWSRALKNNNLKWQRFFRSGENSKKINRLLKCDRSNVHTSGFSRYKIFYINRYNCFGFEQ